MSTAKKQTGIQAGFSGFNQSHAFLFILIAVVLYAVFKIIAPYLNSIILSIILGSLFHPIHRRLLQWTGNRRNLSALLSCMILFIVVVLPLTFVVFSMIQQGIVSFNAIQDWLKAGNLEKLLDRPIVNRGIDYIHRYYPTFDFHNIEIDDHLIQLSSQYGKTLLEQGRNILGNLTALVIKFFMVIFVFFFIVRDGEAILEKLLHLLPLSSTQERKIIDKIKAVSQSAILGTLITAIAQGAAIGVAFWIVGLPGLFWGLIAAFTALIPVVGTAMIWVPASIYLFLSGRYIAGSFLVAWSVGFVGVLDNIIRPLFMKGSAGMSPLLIFFAILGGINVFGLIGILYGPLIFGIAMVLLFIYELEYGEFLKQQDRL